MKPIKTTFPAVTVITDGQYRGEVVPVDGYQQQALSFLSRNGLKLRITLSNSKVAPWNDGTGEHNHYRVTVSRKERYEGYIVGTGKNAQLVAKPPRLVFDYFGSIADAKAGTPPSEYDVLACLSSYLHCDDTLADFCANMGYSEDSIKARQTFTRCKRFSERLQEFFTENEQTELTEIQ